MEPNRIDSRSDHSAEDDSQPLRELHRLMGSKCSECLVVIPARALVCSTALGFKNAPRCFGCLARGLDRDETDLHNQLVAYVHRRECYRIAWNEAGKMDGEPTDRMEKEADPPSRPLAVPFGIADHWDAGDLGCGELVMALRMRMNSMLPGSVIQVTATDPAAPEDLPAWCRLCGHRLLTVTPPNYFIQRKGA